MARNAVATKHPNVADGTYEWHFANGQKLSAAVASLPQHIRDRLLLHGLGQKVGDSYASAEGDVDAAIESARSVLDNLHNGNWGAERESTGGRAVLDMIEATVRILERAGKPANRDEIAATVRRLASETKTTTSKDGEVKEVSTGWLRKKAQEPRFASVLAEIAKERADKRAAAAPEAEDADELLG